MAPKGTPSAIIDRIYRDLLEVLAASEIKAYMANAGIEIVGSTPGEFGAFFRAERDQWARIVRETGAKAD
jgi:tripartite-type tricarboxylate transporter receptor subunit TctC